MAKRDQTTGKIIPELRKPAGARAGARKPSSDKGLRQPGWTHLTFEDIESARVGLGLPKTKMAALLGVTNSTYHNWMTGRAVPHLHRQQALRRLVDGALRLHESGRIVFRAGSGTIERLRSVVANASRGGTQPVLRSGDVGALCKLLTAYAETHPDQVTLESFPDLVRDLVRALYD